MEWIRTTEKFFSMVYVPEEAKGDDAQMYLIGRADVWLRNSGILEQNLTWEQFCQVVLKRFSGDRSYEVVENFNSIKQGTNSVSDYTDRFEEKMSSYKRENPGVSESNYIKCYINGLKPKIKHYLKPFKPQTLYDAVDTARDMELGTQAQTTQKKFPSYTNYQKSNSPAPTTNMPRWNDGSAPKREGDPKTTAKPEVRYREPGICRYCGSKWFFGHKCAQYKTLNLMATEETPEENQEDLLQETEQPDDHTAPVTSPTEEEQCMQISSQAVGKKTTAKSFSLQVQIGGKCGIALVDSGSSHTFIDMKFTVKTTCHTVPTPMETVLVAGGGTLQSGSQVVETQYTIQGHKFKNSFKVLPLKGYDIILADRKSVV